MSSLIGNSPMNRAAKGAQETLRLVEALPEMPQEEQDNLKAMMAYKGSGSWEGLQVIPPGSFLEDVVELFRGQTDIPLELPLMAALSHVSGFLNAKGVQYEIGGALHAPKLWTIVLAPSGSGKTFAATTVGRWLSDANNECAVPELANASSAAQFIANIQQTPKGLWIRDEFGQFLNQVQNLQYMEPIKDILLRAYSGSQIEYLTKGTKIVVRHHALTVLGINVVDTFERQIGADSLVDGFAQRFNILRAIRDPNRRLEDYPIYFEHMDQLEAQARFKHLRTEWLHLIGRNDVPDAFCAFEPDALQLFKDDFRRFFGEAKVPGSFFRRTMFSVFSYAVVFHFIAGKMGTTIGQDSVSLGLRMIALHLDHARRMLEAYGLSELEKTIRKAEAIREKRLDQGQELKARDLISGIREIKTTAQANAIIGLLSEK